MLLLFVALGISPSLRADPGWLAWGGANRDFKVNTDGLAARWPHDGPPRLWQRELGDGYSSIVVDGERLYTMYAVRAKNDDDQYVADGREVIVALDARTGKTVWEHSYDDHWPDDMDMVFGSGPHSTPLIVGERLFTIGCTVDVYGLDKNSGKVIWSKDLAAEIGASPIQRGYGASPLPYRDAIILPIGGEGKSIIALKQADGSLLWKNQSFGPTFASPLMIEVGGEKQLVTFTAAEVSGLNPDDGELLWSHAHPTQFGANISTPVWCGDGMLFISSAYGMGARGLKLSRADGKTTVEEQWFNPKMKIHHGNAVAVGGTVYGSSGDFGPSFFAAIDAQTGKLAWRERGIAKATCLHANNKLIILDEDGQLLLADPTPKKLEIRSKFQLCERNAWTVPTLVGHTLYVRDRKTITALDLGETPPAQ